MDGKRAVAVAVSVALVLAGCATASKDIASTYVSPNQYASYDCDQLAAEANRIETRVVQLGGRLDQAAQNDAGIMAVGLILFWPVLFALGGTKQQEAEYARLKGEYDAVQQVAVQKKCSGKTPTGQIDAAATPMSPAPAGPTVAMAPVVAAPVQVAQPAPAPAADAAPQPAAVKSSMSAVQAPSRYLIAAERFAKDSGCAGAAATINIRASTYETFTVACAAGDPQSIRCDDGMGCRELK